MVEVQPFKGLRYNKDKISGMKKVIAPPYDVISREYRNELRERSPNNCIHVILGEEIEENREQNLYEKAAQNFKKWIKEKVLVKEEKPAVYAYEQVYTLKDGSEYSRKGIIPLVKLEPFEKGIVLPHEFTLSGPKEDRLELLRATETNTEPIFALYRDKSNKIKSLLEEVTEKEPQIEVEDDNGIINRLWAIGEQEKIKLIQKTLGDKKMFIADGHHRYETHLIYQKENPKADAMPVLLVEMHDPGLIVLPTHRLLYGLKGFEFEEFKEKLNKWFEVIEVDGNAMELEKELAEKKEKAFLARANEKTILFSLKESVDLSELMPDSVEEIRQLDVSILHKLVIEKILNISPEQIQKKENIEYVKDFKEAIKKADSEKYNIAFLMNPTKKEQMIRTCLAGERMPQKSTYFYPKVLSGLFFRKIE